MLQNTLFTQDDNNKYTILGMVELDRCALFCRNKL